MWKKRPRLVIDWHNLGFTMFGRPKSVITKVAKQIENILAPLADGHLCVSKAMAQWLVDNFGIQREKISVLYDRPPEFFQPTNVETMHRLMNKLQSKIVEKCPQLETQLPDKTIFTQVVNCNGNSEIVQRHDRPILLVSSTSWTPDEDFSILLNALVALEKTIVQDRDHGGGEIFPHVIVIVTGKGPEKEFYENRIAHLKLKNVTILTMWLETCDYPKLLGCADLGISLHVSTSGLDLPMKVLDMFGCEVPVCAFDFGCLGELVKDGENGRVFSSELELAQQLRHLLDGKRGKDNKILGDLDKFRQNIRGMARWSENWIEHAHDMILGIPAVSDDKFVQKKIQ
jgi:beta-1,4-mannosyltransferase